MFFKEKKIIRKCLDLPILQGGEGIKACQVYQQSCSHIMGDALCSRVLAVRATQGRQRPALHREHPAMARAPRGAPRVQEGDFSPHPTNVVALLRCRGSNRGQPSPKRGAPGGHGELAAARSGCRVLLLHRARRLRSRTRAHSIP